jgi:hypothetical protein
MMQAGTIGKIKPFQKAITGNYWKRNAKKQAAGMEPGWRWVTLLPLNIPPRRLLMAGR